MSTHNLLLRGIPLACPPKIQSWSINFCSKVITLSVVLKMTWMNVIFEPADQCVKTLQVGSLQPRQPAIGS